jgi:hypothetical protein
MEMIGEGVVDYLHAGVGKQFIKTAIEELNVMLFAQLFCGMRGTGRQRICCAVA